MLRGNRAKLVNPYRRTFPLFATTAFYFSGGHGHAAPTPVFDLDGKKGQRLIFFVHLPTLEGRGFDVRPLVAGGLQMGPCYYYIWEELNTFSGGQIMGFLLGEDLDDKSKYPEHVMRFLEWPTATGEFCTGGALALGLVRTYLWGKSGGTVCAPDCTGKPCGADDGCGTPCGHGCHVADAGAFTDGPRSDGPGAQVLDQAGVPVPAEAGTKKNDAGASPLTTEPPPDSGCSCRAASGDQGTTGALALLLVMSLLGLTRRHPPGARPKGLSPPSRRNRVYPKRRFHPSE